MVNVTEFLLKGISREIPYDSDLVFICEGIEAFISKLEKWNYMSKSNSLFHVKNICLNKSWWSS